MEQNEFIRKSIEQGKKEIENAEKILQAQEESNREIVEDSWGRFIRDIHDLVHPDLQMALYFKDIDRRERAPALFCKISGDVKLLIKGLAPIYLRFTPTNKFDHYLVPAVNSDHIHNTHLDLRWFAGTSSNYWLEGTKVVSTENLAYALAMAERNYKVYAEYQSKRQKVKVSGELHFNEPVYVPVVESTPDAQAMSAIRAIIREEIHRLAYAD